MSEPPPSKAKEGGVGRAPGAGTKSVAPCIGPGMVVRRHGHYSPHVVFVIEGEIRCGDTPCPAGTHIELPLGAAFGPFVAGEAGAVLFEVMMGDPRSWGDDHPAFEQALSEQGAVALPDPEIELPAWLADRRGTWAGE